MDKSEEIIVALLRFGLFGGEEPCFEGETDWNAVLQASQKHAVTALTYDAILKLPTEKRPPRQVLFHFTSLTADIEKSSRQRQTGLNQFAEAVYNEVGLKTPVTKGFCTARHYPNLSHRECGDNDLYFGSSADKVDKIAAKLGAKVNKENQRHSAFRLFGANFENHAYLLYGEKEPEWGFIDSGTPHVVYLNPTHEALFCAAHTEYHAMFFNTPIVLRSLVDWALIVTQPDFDYEAFCHEKRGMGFDRFSDLMTQWCVANLGIASPNGWEPLSERCLREFDPMYLYEQKRSRWAAVRVAKRSRKYLRYGTSYKEIYGISPFRKFYFKNVGTALKQAVGIEKVGKLEFSKDKS